MDMALGEITLVVFTTIAPAGALGYAYLAAGILFMRDNERAKKLSTYLIVPLVFSLVGLIASATHLGTPANALYVLTGIGRSPLSNEVVAAASFLALGGAVWILSFGHRGRDALSALGLAAASCAAAVFVAFVSLAYAVESIPTWNMPLVPLTLWMNAFASGSLVALLAFLCADVMPSRRFALVCVMSSFVAAFANTVLLVLEYRALHAIVTTVAVGVDLVPFMPAVIVLFAVCSVLGAAFCCMAALRRGFARLAKRRRRIVLGALGTALVLAGCFMVRFSFYAMYMTWGV